MRATATAGLCLALAAALLQQPAPSSSAQSKPAPPVPAWEIAFDTDTPRDVVADDATLYSSGNSVLEALSIDDGKPRWSRPLTEPAILVPGGPRLFVVTDGRVAALDATTGEDIWSGELPPGPALASWGPGLLAAAVDTGVFLFNDTDGAPVASAGLEAPLGFPPIVTRTMVLAAPGTDRLIGIDPASGRRVWAARLESPATAISAAADRVYVSGANGGLYCFRPPRIRYEWRFSLYARASGAATADGTLVYATLFDNTVQAIRRTSGTRRWSHTLSNRPATAAWPAGDRLFVALADGTVAVIRAADGAPLSELKTTGETRQLEAAGLVPGSPPAFFTLSRGTSGVRRLTLWRPQS